MAVVAGISNAFGSDDPQVHGGALRGEFGARARHDDFHDYMALIQPDIFGH